MKPFNFRFFLRCRLPNNLENQPSKITTAAFKTSSLFRHLGALNPLPPTCTLLTTSTIMAPAPGFSYAGTDVCWKLSQTHKSPGRKECSLVPHPPPLEDVNLLGYVSNKPRQPINHDVAESSLLVASVLGILAHSLTSGSPFGLQSPTDAKIRVGGKKRKKWSSPSLAALSLSLSLSSSARAPRFRPVCARGTIAATDSAPLPWHHRVSQSRIRNESPFTRDSLYVPLVETGP